MTTNEGWFDAFRDNGGILLYSSENRTPAIEDVRNILIYTTFGTLFVAFLIIFPGIRKERFSTFICVTISLFIGAVILGKHAYFLNNTLIVATKFEFYFYFVEIIIRLIIYILQKKSKNLSTDFVVANFGTSWHVAQATISSPYRAFSKEKISAKVGVNVGLQSVNITLKANPVHKKHEEINYNERFFWIGPTEMKQEYQNALAKGLPFPILTIAEYLSQNGEGFCWGRRYRLAGYYSNILLWVAFACWLLMNLLLCAVPRYGVFTMQITGVIMLLANAVYALLLPRKPLTIPFEGGTLTFAYGWCFWINLIAGITAVIVGALVAIIDTLFPNKFSTILEVDYDTPYRYFVGNDAHLFGGLAMLSDQHECPHMARRRSESANTETTTCCAISSTRTEGSIASNRANLSSKTLGKRRSDASTSTVMSIPVKQINHHPTLNRNNRIELMETSLTTTAEIEREPEASVSDNDNHADSKDINERDGVENRAFQKEEENDSDSSEVSTTIIDGKRAVSLANFGKFQRQQTIEAQKEGKTNTMNTAFWY
ncbi:dual oxidase maturation factor 2-like protein [Dinothrombium tinctorium]|uniref:Dual oxidase maturation factor 2-like protein n=1 Tax=Dinothrombium tinctorium TaxID=1965070 RepID=A0A3S3SH88_9ACAR|nr:dual oxidase maturation factor 2-like protein [Dinothrombium tinctorium]RWS14018.1 dual oxidase maturation factor 2-like protein [Dinothrombium tinctorium]RWS14062.1 dual oxidase maturation factor 2-like protein [Dinothrombium tinctorium]RWS16727.1 dual oxidase maturation factor 2-like protein [Dinothrombium tinctorium]